MASAVETPRHLHSHRRPCAILLRYTAVVFPAAKVYPTSSTNVSLASTASSGTSSLRDFIVCEWLCGYSVWDFYECWRAPPAAKGGTSIQRNKCH
jgi:hypothetical protein